LVISDIRKSQETNKSNLLSQYDARCEWAILEDIQMLLDLTNADMAKKRVENSAPSKKIAIIPLIQLYIRYLP